MGHSALFFAQLGALDFVVEPFARMFGYPDRRRMPWWLAYLWLSNRNDSDGLVNHLITPPRSGGWEVWFQATWQRGYRIAFAILRNHEDACDAVSSALLRIEAVPTTPREFDFYFDRAVRNRALEMLAERKRNSRLTELNEENQCPNNEISAEEAMVDDERRRMVRRAVSTLPVDEREVITLHYFEELTVPEIAALKNVEQHTVRNRLTRGRRLLAWKLAPTVGLDAARLRQTA